MKSKILKIDSGLLAPYTDKEVEKVFKAVVKYANDFETPAREDFSKAEYILFMVYKQKIDENELRYKQRCEMFKKVRTTQDENQD